MSNFQHIINKNIGRFYKMNLTFNVEEVISFLIIRGYSIFEDVRKYTHWDKEEYELKIPIPYKQGDSIYQIPDSHLSIYYEQENRLLFEFFETEMKKKLLEQDKRTIIVN